MYTIRPRALSTSCDPPCGTRSPGLPSSRASARHGQDPSSPTAARVAMRWESGRRSENIEDRRGMRVRPAAAAGGGLGMVALVLIALFLGVDPSVLLQGGGSPQLSPAPPSQEATAPGKDPARDFVAVVLA